MSVVGCSLWLWHSLNFSLTFCFLIMFPFSHSMTYKALDKWFIKISILSYFPAKTHVVSTYQKFLRGALCWVLRICLPKKWAKLLTNLITKTRLCSFELLKPHFYIVKLGFTGVDIIFLISAQNIDCRYSLEPTRRGSTVYKQSMFWAEIWKILEFLSEIFQFWWWNFQYIWIGVFS